MPRWVGLLLGALAACDDGAATDAAGMVVGFATDFPSSEALSGVHINVRLGGAAAESLDWPLPWTSGATHQLPGSYRVSAAPGTPVDIELFARFGAADLLQRSATFTPMDGGSRFLRMALVTRCLNVECAPYETCIEGRCAARAVDAALLPAYQPGMERARSCNSHSVFLDTTSGMPLPLAGKGSCGDGETCREGTCYPQSAVLRRAARVRFAPPVLYPVGQSPWFVAGADFDGDGRLDLAVSNVDPNALESPAGGVSLLLGKGDGTFKPGATYPTAAGVPSLVTGDLDGDGRPDIAYVDRSAPGVQGLLGGSDGKLHAGGTFGTFPGPVWMRSGDVNRDGRPDLVVTSPLYGNGGAIALLASNGAGTFKPRVALHGGLGCYSTTAMDLDGDGRLDLAVANASADTVSILSGRGDGTFAPVMASPTGDQLPVWSVAGDLDEDGRLDLVVAHVGPKGGTGSVGVLLADGGGRFRKAVIHPLEGVNIVELADVDGDGHLDLVTTGRQALNVLLGNGDGTLRAPIAFDAGVDAVGLLVRDLDGDGRPDAVITAGPTDGVVAVMLNRSE